ncbi:MAG: acyl carrier protein [Chitinivibrionales bacterium]|nr:acyl carrier protein [Chitinivibrionales bacterium]
MRHGFATPNREVDLKYINEVKQFIVDNFLFGDDSKLQNDTSFLESGIIDSTGILEVITFLEETYDIKVEDEEMLPENLDSLNNISTFVTKKSSS